MFKKTLLLFAVLISAAQIDISLACTNFLITKGASSNGSSMITYAADSHVLYGELYFWEAGDHPSGSMRDIYDWDSREYMGKIKEAPHTYQVIGNMNEHNLAISETTYGGRKELEHQSNAIMDYGSLIYVTLSRAKTAREAIAIMTDLVAEYGYASSGESFSICDKDEVWIMEMIGKGDGEKGAVWVARRIPDGYISGHANQARITTFPLDDKENCIYSKDVIDFARKKGYYKGKDKDFSFSDTYAPVDFGAARFCEARVWSGFRKVNGDMDQYEAYASGKVQKDKNGVATNRMPLWIKPDRKLSVQDVMGLMRDHFEGTSLDMTQDVGAGPFKCPYRWRDLTWEVDGKTYCNERAISTQQTGFSFVAQCRSNLPDPIAGILWFGVDDTYSTCYSPIYCGSKATPECFKVGNGDIMTWSDSSAYWVFNEVANFCYSRYSDIIVDIQKVQNKLETKYVEETPAVDGAALKLWNSGKKELALEYITDFSVNTANAMTDTWKNLGHYLMIKYRDGNVLEEEKGKFKTTKEGLPLPEFKGYPKSFYKAIVDQTGNHFEVIE